VLLIALVLHHTILIVSVSHALDGGKHTFFPSALRSSLAAIALAFLLQELPGGTGPLDSPRMVISVVFASAERSA
jgi:hypothetical protein